MFPHYSTPDKFPFIRLTAAVIDRLVHHAHILAFDGESYRLKKALSGLTQGQNEREVVLQS